MTCQIKTVYIFHFFIIMTRYDHFVNCNFFTFGILDTKQWTPDFIIELLLKCPTDIEH